MPQGRRRNGDMCRNIGCGLENEDKAAEGKKAREKCDVRFSLIGKNRVSQNNYMRTGTRKLLRTGLLTERSW